MESTTVSTRIVPSRGTRRRLTFLDLPRHVRDRVYRHVFRDSAPRESEGDTYPDVPEEHFGLLCVSRQVYEEASEILYESVHLGSHPLWAYDYLNFIGPVRRLQIRNLTIRFKCCWDCVKYRDAHDWAPVFEFLWLSWACLRTVHIHFDPHPEPNYRYKPGAEETCRFKLDARDDSFWWDLRKFTTVREICFPNPVPEYFVRQHAKAQGWLMDGTIGDDNGLSTFTGKLVNPTYPDEFDWVNEGNRLYFLGIDVSNFSYDFYKNVYLKDEAPRPQPTGSALADTPRRTGFLDLPIELRRDIYDRASEWVYKPFWPDRPAHWNTGFGLLLVSKQISQEALPSIYRTFRINGGTPLGMLDTLGRNIQHVQWLNNATIYAAINPESTYTWGGVVADWYPTAPVVKKDKDEWSQVMDRIQAQRGISELAVTFLSCCRSPVTYLSWVTTFTLGLIDAGQQYQSCCRAVEDHFINLLINCCGVRKFSLAGRVPPSLTLRLTSSRSPEADNSGYPTTALIPPFPTSDLTAKFVSQAMAAFIKAAEEQRREWETLVHDNPGIEEVVPWVKTSRLPPLEYTPTSPPSPHFVLMRDYTARAQWLKLVEPESNGMELAKGMQAVVGPLSTRTWQDVAGFLDSDDDQDG